LQQYSPQVIIISVHSFMHAHPLNVVRTLLAVPPEAATLPLEELPLLPPPQAQQASTAVLPAMEKLEKVPHSSCQPSP
jgi:hypothetical protein